MLDEVTLEKQTNKTMPNSEIMINVSKHVFALQLKPYCLRTVTYAHRFQKTHAKTSCTVSQYFSATEQSRKDLLLLPI